MSQDVTAIDFFCGAGGSSTGLVNAGLHVVGAANHWKLAIDTHNTNHPDTEHFLDDLQQAHPSWYPRADIAWFSPECTNHSLAKGKKRKGISQLSFWDKPAVDATEERSRATMREVLEFSAYHRYEAVIVENVVDIRHWQFYDEWLTAMLNLGYEHKILYLNAQFFGVPQSRDRFYAVFWKKGNRAPNLDFRPRATCPKHGEISAVQAWKKEQHWGRYGARRQYTYRCPSCGHEVTPAFQPASSVIDWSIPSERIGEREKPLKEKTIQRILAGLKKFGDWPHVADLAHSHAANGGKVHDARQPLPTQTSQQRHALVHPFITSYYSRQDVKGWPVSELSEALPTIPGDNRHSLVVPPFVLSYANAESPPRTTDEPLFTLATGYVPRVVIPPFISVQRGDPNYAQNFDMDNPLTTIVAAGSQHYLVQPPFITAHYNNAVHKGVDEPMPTLMNINHHSLLVPPFLASVNYFDDRCVSVDEPLPTQTTANKLALVMSYYGDNPTYVTVDQPLPTMRTVSHEALITPEDMLPECGFRMLEPHELKRGMSFPDTYVILGSKRDQVKQVGNAVCPNVAEWIGARVMESLS